MLYKNLREAASKLIAEYKEWLEKTLLYSF